MVDKPLPGCAEGCVLLLLDDSVDGIYGQVCCYDFKVNLFSFLLICAVAVPYFVWDSSFYSGAKDSPHKPNFQITIC